MSRTHEITIWLNQLKTDSSSAAQHLWEVYFQQMVHIARSRLPKNGRAVVDEEDVALSAFKSFCQGVKHGRFAHLADRESLWSLLVAITLNKARQTIRHESRQKRGGGQHLEPLWEDIISKDPTPEFTLQLAEQIELVFALLDQAADAQLRPIVLWTLEGYTTEEIAERLGCATRTVQRKLTIVRRVWMEGEGE